MLDFIGFIDDTANLEADEKALLLIDFCTQYNYQPTIPGKDGSPIPNPESRRDFANRHVSLYVTESVNAVRRDVAMLALEFEELKLEPVEP